MIFESSSDSFGSEGGARTSDTFSRFSCRRSVRRHLDAVVLGRLLGEPRAGLVRRLVRARGERFRVVGDVGLLHPAGLRLLDAEPQRRLVGRVEEGLRVSRGGAGRTPATETAAAHPAASEQMTARPSVLSRHALNYRRMRIGIDLGGTKIEGIAIADDGSERLRRRIPAPRGDYASTLAAVTGLVRDIERELAVEGTVGVGIPGTISQATGRIKNANSTWLNGTPLLDDLSRMLDRPIRLANDANCFALSEATDGAGAGAAVVFGVIIGTGTGGGVVVDRRVLTGANGVAGEWGHNPLPAPRDGESPGPVVLLRAPRVHRDVPLGAGPGARLRRRRRGRRQRAGDRGSRRRGRGARARGARTIRGAPGARARQRHQPPRPGRRRARRRVVEYQPAVRACPAALGPVRVLGHGLRRAWRGPSMATRAASAARRGCGAGTRTRSRD